MANPIAWPARWSGSFPEVRHHIADATNGANIVAGSFVVITSNELELCGADPGAVYGVALGKFNGAAGYGMANSPSQVTYRAQTIPVAVASSTTEFAMTATSAPALSNIGVSYGVVNTSGVWQVDFTDTTNKVVIVTDVDVDRAICYCKIHEDVAQQSAAT